MSQRALISLLGIPAGPLVVLFTIGGGIIGFLAHVPFDWLATRLKTQNKSEIAGHFLGLVGVIYAVVLAFVVVTAWQERDHAQEVSMEEESAVSDLFDTVRGMHSDPLTVWHIQVLLLNYARLMEGEWREMHYGQPLCEYANFLNEIRPECKPVNGRLTAARLNNTLLVRIDAGILGLNPKGTRDETIYDQALPLLSTLLDTRRHRRHHYHQPALEEVMWLAFFLGAVIIVGLLYLTEEASRGQRVRGIALCAMIGMMWGLAIAFDHPFVGTGGVDGSQWCRIVEHFKLEMNPSLAEQSDPCHIDFGNDTGF